MGRPPRREDGLSVTSRHVFDSCHYPEYKAVYNMYKL
jgi:hypothetical protein